MHKIIVFASMILFFGISLCFAQPVPEEIKVTTYYPSPYGVYDSLLTDKLGVGDNNGDAALTSADVPTTSGEVWIAGDVGIGTTNPGAKLAVRGGVDETFDIENSDASQIWNIFSSSGFGGSLYFRNVTGADTKFRFQANGAAYAESGPWTTGGVDFAEYFEQLNEGELQPYDQVCLAGDNKVRRCKGSEDPIGVITTNPAFVGGEDFEESKKENPKNALVGLIGQVELRLTHDVKTGDIVAPDRFAKIIALEDGRAGEIIRALVK